MNIKKKLGFFKRGIWGMLENLFDYTPDVCISPESIGNSKEEREISLYRIGNGKTKIIFIAGIHGNEVGTVKFALSLINYLSLNQLLKENFTFLVVPCLNPDGYEQALKNPDYFGGGKAGRFNKNGVDLNRNFDVPSFEKKSVWSSGKSYSEKTEVYCGERGNSELETKALVELIRVEKPKVIFADHSCGREVMGNELPLSRELVDIYCEYSGFKNISHQDWQKMGQTGTLKEWSKLNNISYVEVENSTRWGSDFKYQKIALEKVLEHLICEKSKNE